MDKNIFLIVFVASFAVCSVDTVCACQPKLPTFVPDIKEGAGSYGQYPGGYPGYPGGPSGPSSYPGQYPGQYPSGPGLQGPPGAHPGCPLCDSSVYSYCNHKQSHDACCCENPSYIPFNCRKSDCNFIYANSCSEYNLISRCCCVDLQKSANPGVPIAPIDG